MKIKTSWNLKLLYKSESDPQIEKDIRTIEKLYADFEKKDRGKLFTKTPQALLKALKDSEKADEYMEHCSPMRYLHFKTDLDANDHKSFATATKYGQRLTEADNKTRFFGLEIAKIPANKQKQFLNYPALKPYKYMLEQTFVNAKYNMSEPEEQIRSLLGQPAFGMWVDAQDKLLNKQIIKVKGEDVPIAKALAEL